MAPVGPGPLLPPGDAGVRSRPPRVPAARSSRIRVLSGFRAGGIDYFAIDGSDHVRHAATLFALEQLGEPFDFLGLTRFFLRLALGLRSRGRADRRWFCAELVATAYRRQGVELTRTPACYATPKELAESPRALYLHTVKS